MKRRLITSTYTLDWTYTRTGPHGLFPTPVLSTGTRVSTPGVTLIAAKLQSLSGAQAQDH